jgi:DNA-binding MarR family transcriptional regulator
MRYVMPPRAAPVGDGSYRTLAAFRYALRRFLRFSEQAAERAGLTPQQHQALLAVRGWAGTLPITVGELAEQLQVQHHSAVGLVDRLVAEGLVVRRTDTADRRRIRLAVTAGGRRLLAKLSSAHRDELRQLRPQLVAMLESLGP